MAGAKAEAEATRVARIDAVFILVYNNLFEGDVVKGIPNEMERARDGRQFLFLLPKRTREILVIPVFEGISKTLECRLTLKW